MMSEQKHADQVVSDHELLTGNDDAAAETSEDLQNISEEEKRLEKKLLRKIDWLIMPLIVVIYLMNFIDRLVLTSNRIDEYY